MANILLVDADAHLSAQIAEWISLGGHALEKACTTGDAAAITESKSIDAIVVDTNDYVAGAITFCETFRSAGGTTPILIISERHEVDCKTAAFDSGADDYLVKPAFQLELSARVAALLRRPHTLSNRILDSNDLQVDMRNREVRKAGTRISLAPREFALIELFVRNPDQMFSADDIIDRLWPLDAEVGTNLVKVFVYKLRKKLNCVGDPVPIKSVRGVGYLYQVG